MVAAAVCVLWFCKDAFLPLSHELSTWHNNRSNQHTLPASARKVPTCGMLVSFKISAKIGAEQDMLGAVQGTPKVKSEQDRLDSRG